MSMDATRERKNRRGSRWMLNFGIIIALAALVVIAVILYPGFLAPDNIRNILTQNAPVGLIAIGMTFVIISRGFDLSVGAVYALSSVTFAGVMLTSGSMFAAALATIGVSLLCGAINGYLVSYAGVNPFIATLGTSSVYAGAAYVVSNSAPFIVSDPSFKLLATARPFGVPMPIYILIVCFVLAGIVLHLTQYGRNIFALGGNPEATWLSGVRVRSLGASVYVVAGVLAGIAGMIDTSRLGVGQANVGANMALDAIAIVIIGGTALSGGEGAIWRSATGLLLLATITNIFYSLNISQQWQLIAKGIIVVGAVALDVAIRKRQR